jgi:4-amino-4-deoxy-L-arabinose transferase-like glycosyltransferase
MSSGDRKRRWLYALLAICAVALGLRVGYVLGWRDVPSIEGDARYYHDGANLLADGEGFVHPYAWRDGVRIAGADHPPAYIVVLALPSLLGLDSIRDHMLASCLIGTGTVALVGLLGRRIGGDRVGLLAALLAAVYPNMWLNDGALMSETLALFLGVVVSLAAYRAWDRPSTRRFAELGVAIGLAALARAEAVLMILLLVVPLVVWVQGLSGWRPRARQGVIAAAMAVLVMAPWVVANMVRFEHPATLSTQAGPTLDVANCDETYDGDALGAWSFACATAIDEDDRSVLDKRTRDEAFTYIGDHLGRLPVVVAARLGRAWALYVPFDQLRFDSVAEARPLPASRVGLGMYYVLAGLSVVGVVALRRRGEPSFPLTVWLVNVAITVVVFYGMTRFRAPAEPFLVLLGAVGLLALVDRRPPPSEAMEVDPERPRQ